MSITATELSSQFTSLVAAAARSIVRVEGGRRHPTTGVAWDATHVVTVAHGIDQDEVVVVADGNELKGRVVGRDEATDLALLEVHGPLTPAVFDDGAGLQVGQLVLRLGRPGDTVRATSGIVSTVGLKPFRTSKGGEIDRFVESDAAHHPGFSGGPLLGLGGAVIGLTSSALVRNTSLTIPTLTIRRVVGQLSAHGRVRKSYLGLKLQPVQLPEDVQKHTGDEIGLLVLGVEKGGPAETAGLTYGDTVLHLGDDTVRTLHDFYGYLRTDHSGQQVPVKFFRNGQISTVQVTLGAA
jgi:S1-C subfamily serine protease